MANELRMQSYAREEAEANGKCYEQVAKRLAFEADLRRRDDALRLGIARGLLVARGALEVGEAEIALAHVPGEWLAAPGVGAYNAVGTSMLGVDGVIASARIRLIRLRGDIYGGREEQNREQVRARGGPHGSVL
jgi:hypothetical protein